MNNDPNKRNVQYAINLSMAGLAGQVGFVTLAIVFGALFGGLWLDSRFDTKPVFTILLIVASGPLSLFMIFRLAMTAISKIKPVGSKTDQPELTKENNAGE